MLAWIRHWALAFAFLLAVLPTVCGVNQPPVKIVRRSGQQTSSSSSELEPDGRWEHDSDEEALALEQADPPQVRLQQDDSVEALALAQEHDVAAVSSQVAAPPAAAPPPPPPAGQSSSGAAAAMVAAGPRDYTVELLRTMPHADRPWTQGLEFASDGRLIETSGDYPRGSGSFVRVLNPTTGAVAQKVSEGMDGPDGHVFIEGISELDGRFFASTYEDHKAIEYDSNLKFVRSHDFPHIGWGLTHTPDRKSFIATNGSAYVMLLEPGSFKLLSATPATCMGKAVEGLNELEMVDDFLGHGPALLGNIMNTRLVLVLDPSTFACRGAFHLEGLEPSDTNENFGFHVANGIAYNTQTRTFWVTGKNWVSMFEVRVSEDPKLATGQGALQMLSTHLSTSPVLVGR
mmetsp:Transcript_59862/g.161323  ORF Transcript_59862/g.161323 Transcript_59862/m.161323 type:complete len:402 (-) Transcript_59862:164-1369(-)